ncbi:phospholipase D-like domain-containing protein [Desulfobacter vibrioformis]|uniref:phospholipase D-like domain-containing protein n=1 Tax=Desulfobacter vibrioformis TaxID=34031 RepID=UPI001FE0E28B|nr:phospholipase D-like domain-containing protein [Desulfobacter vibrioformis]
MPPKGRIGGLFIEILGGVSSRISARYTFLSLIEIGRYTIRFLPICSTVLIKILSYVTGGTHPKKLTDRISNVVCLTGGMGDKETARVTGAIKEIKDTEPFVLVATGSYIGEGFDEARLDTLFLAMPIAWKGTLHQYAGRLHRYFKNKKDVRIYDYVDLHVKMLEKMYGKRLKGYASIGYKAKASKFPDAPTNIIFNKDDFFAVYLRDIAVASKHLLIISPFVTKKRMLQMMDHFNDLLQKQVKITVITRPANDYDENRKAMLSNLFSTVETAGVQMVYKSNIHQKFAIIDNKITWYGSINLLSFGYSEESIMRLESSSIACELAESINVGAFFNK